jgi:hypothetical protein
VDYPLEVVVGHVDYCREAGQVLKVQLEAGLEAAMKIRLGAELALALDPEAEAEGRTLVVVLVRFG